MGVYKGLGVAISKLIVINMPSITNIDILRYIAILSNYIELGGEDAINTPP